MRHTRFLSTKVALCEDASMLGRDFVYLDSEEEEPYCGVCGSLLTAHNKREAIFESLDRFDYILKEDQAPFWPTVEIIVYTSLVWIAILSFVIVGMAR